VPNQRRTRRRFREEAGLSVAYLDPDAKLRGPTPGRKGFEALPGVGQAEGGASGGKRSDGNDPRDGEMVRN